ncbi:hypothetical protein BDM02DRAFT_3273228 [Thelephora ganbajun]|uniref:Uncharacterized protein n=1 Tax=Thelephora ganbajun TaxID=370292 RepID=A0ACB6Z0H1_THEGA|nr:hypothetical protein BDM02DRAFT_3273228 [Thelephora ganbajun]
MILIVLREREHERQVSSSTPNNHFSHNATDLSSEWELEVQNRGECENVHDAVQLGSRVPERDYRDTTLGAAPIPMNVPKEAAGGFSPLKVILGAISAIYANREKTVGIWNKIEDLLSRIEALEACFATLPGNVVEQRRQSELIRELGRIEGQLRSLPDKPEPRRLDEHVQDDEGVSAFLEDVREIIFDYQMAQQTAMYKQACKLISPAEASVLKDFRYAQGAEYRHGDRRGCLKGTRTAVLDQIELWTRDFDKPPVYWLNGLAGTGKSTIAQTIAERIFADGQLGASFFCSRDFEDRRNLHFIFPTLAVQLARKYSEFRSIFVPLVQSDPEIVDESLYNQMKKLIDVEPASAILSVLGQFISEIPKVKFFLTGRPEPRIRRGFGRPLLAEATDVFVLHEVESSRVDSDIRLFLRHSFLEIANRPGGRNDRPTEEQLNLFCERAAGLFVYAVATVKFIDHRNKNPKKQLDLLLLLSKSTAYEGKTKFKADTTLDSLYASILQEAFSDDDPGDDPMVRSVLGAVILAANPLSPSTIGTLLSFDAEYVFPLLSSIHSLLTLQDIDQPVRPFHKSFPDFIVDPARCIDQRFRVSPPNHHVELLIGCFNLMNRTLEKNMCKLPDAITNSQVPDLRERTERYISSALQYACKSWHKHLVDEHTVRTPKITSALHRFLENKFVFWLEVLGVLGAAREAVGALDLVTKWLEVSPTIELANDCFRFVTGFFKAIEESAAHIYHSALPLSPQMSMVRKLYGPYANPLTRIVRGLPDSWNPAVATMEYLYTAAAWSPCGRFIAISNHKSRTEILDAATLKRLNILGFLEGRTRKLVFSPDARLLTIYNPNPEKFITWNLQTGVLVSAISPEQWDGDTECSSITHSTCGTMFGALIHKLDTLTIRTYNVHSGTHIYSHSVEGKVEGDIWTHGECLRFAVVNPQSITTWEVGFASRNTPTKVESLPLPDNLPNGLRIRSFHPTLSRLAFIHSERIFVWDARHSKFLLNERAPKYRNVFFSSDGRFFVYETPPSEICLWKESPTGYILHRKLNWEAGISELLISPTGESVLVFNPGGIQLWRTMDSNTSFCKRTYGKFIVGFSPDETFAAVTRSWDNTITVLDLTSGNLLSTIDAGMKVRSQRVTGSTVVAVSDERVVTWNLPARDCNLTTRADAIRMATMIGCPGMFSYPNYLQFVSISPDLHNIAIIEGLPSDLPRLHLYDVPTGQCLGHVSMHKKISTSPWFTPDGREVWCITRHGGTHGLTIVEGSEPSEANGLAIVESSVPGVIKLEHLRPTNQPPSTPPWLSSRGYQITDDGWILGISGKRLLWLPLYLQSLNTAHRTWSGRFLALLHATLPEAVILELEE